MAASLHEFQSKNPPIYSRKEKSLGVLCSNFLKLYNRDGIDSIGLDKAANQLGVERRRIYDIVNILESVGVLTRKAKNQYTWKGFGAIPHALEDLKKQASNDYSRIRKFCNLETVSNESGGLSYSDNSNSDRHAKPPGSSKGENNRKEKSLGLLTQNFIKLFISSNADLISLDTAATALLGDLHDPTAMRTKVRRLYDIANVFQSMDLIEKVRHPESGKPSFRWLGVKGYSNTKPLTMDTNSSKRRVFGTDVTNIAKRHNVDYLLSSKEKGTRPVSHTVLVKDECDENLMMQQPPHSSKDFVFGPFTPITIHEAGASGNKKVRQAPDWEILADTYRPQYLNQDLSDLSGHYAKAWKSWYIEASKK